MFWGKMEISATLKQISFEEVHKKNKRRNTRAETT